MTIGPTVTYESTSDGLVYRASTADEWVLRESAYGRLLRELRPNSRLLDLGGYIGSVALRASNRGAKVLSVEASPDNYSVLHQNAVQFGFKTLHAAVVPSSYANSTMRLPFYVSSDERGHPYCRLSWKRGYTEVQVPIVAIDELQRSFDPNFIKIDIEGLECAIIHELDLSKLDGIAVEYELHTEAQKNAAAEADDHLRAAGLSTEQMPIRTHSAKTRSVVKTYLR